MKIKKIAQLCKETKRIYIYEESGKGIQWLGNGYCAYPMLRMPRLDEESVCAVFDFSDKLAESCSIEIGPFPEEISFKDTDPAENLVESIGWDILYRDNTWKALKTSQGLSLINGKYLSPLEDMKNVALYERVSQNGRIYIAAKRGLFCYGIIVPTYKVGEAFVEIAKQMLINSEYAWEWNKEHTKMTEEGDGTTVEREETGSSWKD